MYVGQCVDDLSRSGGEEQRCVCVLGGGGRGGWGVADGEELGVS